jgi:cytochrome c peroxidase
MKRARERKRLFDRMQNKLLILCCVILFGSCVKDEFKDKGFISDPKTGPKPYYLLKPSQFEDYSISPDNPLTVEGVALGRRLFYDPILSRNQNVACASCHQQENAFSDTSQYSEGTHGDPSGRHSMALFNLAWQELFFWDGRAPSLEIQAFGPVANPVEMDMTWPEVEDRLNNHESYPALFEEAFGMTIIDSTMVAYAIAQFEYTIVSADSKYDRVRKGETEFTNQENAGYIIVTGETGDCFHCHEEGDSHFGNFEMRNNGLDNDIDLKPGYFDVTGRPLDFGKFKVPSLRNIALTPPYMHDGRFETLEEVVEFYSSGVHVNQTVDAKMKFAFQGGVQLDANDQAAVVAFLLTLTDSSLVTNPDYSDPNK